MLDTALAVIAKAILYASALTCAGLVVACFTLRPQNSDKTDEKIRRAAWVSAGAALASLILLFLRLGGGLEAATLGAITGEPIGLGLLVQFLASVLLILTRSRTRLSVIAALGLISAFGIAGHSAAHGLLWGVVAAIHVLFAAWWVGGLWILHDLGHNKDSAAVVRAFSRQALVAVAGLGLAGCGVILGLLGTDIDFASDYVRWLLLKLFLVVNLLGLAALNRLVLTPRLESDPTAWLRLRNSIRTELAVMAAIAIVVAVMTTVSMPEKKLTVSSDQAPAVQAGDLVIRNYMMRASLGNVPTSAVYLEVQNTGPEQDVLLSASCACAERTTLHEMKMEGNLMVMNDIDQMQIPAHQTVRLAPMGGHIMLTGTRHRLVSGSNETLLLRFQKAGEVTLQVPVSDMVPGR